ncbi:acidic phospholipase A2 HTe-like isoform X2 [Limanda limanda]|uniref:acidic phospholipase A2 HTe-like isoform X2 n=1 Tax=Limanda limanda TaxID=27771 RepID=UPI0029C710DA|nr:acidic phospholipase A2 HTe-like isoform X2 [Limanda limanda]
MNALQTLFLLATGLSVALSQHRVSLLDFKNQIECGMYSRPAWYYADYGCWCGKGGSGLTVDRLDRCCKAHDLCWRFAINHPQCRFILDLPYFRSYDYRCNPGTGEVTCLGTNNECQAFICECDKGAANCFATSTYDNQYWNWPKTRCQRRSSV